MQDRQQFFCRIGFIEKGIDSGNWQGLFFAWIDTKNNLPLPDRQRLRRILTEIIPASADAEPCIRWPGGQVRRYAGLLYLLDTEPAVTAAPLKWDLSDGLELGDGRVLQATPVPGKGLKADLGTLGNISVRFRQGGETCRPVGRGHRHSLKNLLQEWGVPPWERARVPLLYVAEDIAAVVGYCVCDTYQAGRDEAGLLLLELADVTQGSQHLELFRPQRNRLGRRKELFQRHVGLKLRFKKRRVLLHQLRTLLMNTV